MVTSGMQRYAPVLAVRRVAARFAVDKAGEKLLKPRNGGVMNKSLYEHCIETDQHVLLEQWNYEKNGDLTARDVSAFSNRKVWWRCEEDHEWQTSVKSRARGKGCPICSNREVRSGFNDLATVQPEIAAQWHPTKNGTLTPDMVVPGKHRKVWWQCSEGHVWQAQIYSRTGSCKCGCPVCANTTSRKKRDRYAAMMNEER